MEKLIRDYYRCKGNTKALIFIVTFRISNFFTINMFLKILGIPIRLFYKIFINYFLGIDISDTTKIGRGFLIYHGQGLVINPSTIIGNDVTVRQNTTIGNSREGGICPCIGSNVEIGANSVIIGNIKVGNHAIIGAGTIVTKIIEPFAIVVGNPARVISTGKIKITYIVSSLANEGPVNVMFNIIKYIDFNIFDISIVCLIAEKKNSRIKDFEKLDIKIFQIAKSLPLAPLALFSMLKVKLNEIRPHIIHSHCPRSLFLTSFLPKNYNKIYTVHIYPGIQQKALYGNFKGELVVRFSNYLMLKTDLPIACSDSVSQQFADIKGWKIKAINNGSSLPIWDDDKAYKQSLRTKLGLTEGVKYFVFIGRFSGEKKPEFIINAFKKLNNSSIGLIMLGEGPMYDELKLEETSLIRLEGFKTNVYEYLIAADFYISASETEGLANTLLESMTVGLPMLLSNIPSHNQIINGSANAIGILFNNSDFVDIINGINVIIKWPVVEVSSNIKEYYKANFTAYKMSEKYQEEYISVSKS